MASASCTVILALGNANFGGSANPGMPISQCEPPSTIAYQSRCTSAGMYRRSGIAPSSTHARLPSVPGEWHPSQTNFWYSTSPLLIVSLPAANFGGSGTGGITTGGTVYAAVAPSLKASSRTGPRADSLVTIVRAGANNLEPDPQPTGVITYCSPFTENVTGMDSIAERVWIDHSCFPLSAANAANSPVPCP